MEVALENSILVGSSAKGGQARILLKMANRHGLITGSTGSGKTITLQTLAEQFSMAGTPVILADVKGDLSGLAEQGQPHEKIDERVKANNWGETYKAQKFPVSFWDIFGEKGLPLRTSLSEMGPVLLSRVLDLNDVQTDLIHIVFKYADDQGLLLLDLKDLKALLQKMGESAKELQLEYGNVSKASLGAIVRRLVTLESAGGEAFFAEPALKIEHIIQSDFSGRGLINVIDAQKLMHDKRLYSSFLLWILSELFENLPEVGDPEKPKLVFFFDEAHLLFDEAPKFLVEKIETVVRLIRSKGVGIFFVSQSPADIPANVLNQLGNKVQHGLRASSEKDRKLIKSVAQNYPTTEGMDIEETITQLGTGESIVTTLTEKGVPSPVLRVTHVPPQSQMGPVGDDQRQEIINKSPLAALYKDMIDRESAFEILKKRKNEEMEVAEKQATQVAMEKEQVKEEKTKEKAAGKPRSNRQSATEAFFKSICRSVGSQVGRSIMRGVLGSMRR